MSWKRMFSLNELMEILTERDFVFVIDEGLQNLVSMINNVDKWYENRGKKQENLLEMIKKQPRLFNLIYKLSDFVAKDRMYFALKCTEGIDQEESRNWSYRHREDILESIIAEKDKQSLSRKEVTVILRSFFLAAPELFLEDHQSNGSKFSVSPPDKEDVLYFLSATQANLDELYAGLLDNNSNPVFLEAWLKLLKC